MKREAFEALWESSLRRELEGLEELRLKERRAIIIGSIVGGAIAIALSVFAAVNEGDIRIGIFGALAGTGLYYLLHPMEYRAKYKDLVIKGLMNQTTYRWEHEAKRAGQDDKYDTLLKESGLYRVSGANRAVADDVFVSKTTSLHCAELHASAGSGKQKRDYFMGLFFAFNLSRSFNGETYLRKAVSYADPVGRSGTYGSLKTISLEWGEFERLLEVKSTDEVEAREILDPRFMAILYDWWVTHKASVRIGFHHNHLYLSAGFGRNLFEPRPFSSIETHKDQLWEYLDAFLLVEKLFDHVEHKYRLTKKLEV